MAILDKSIAFGGQNYLFVEVNEEDETYDYVGSMTARGSILIARYPKDGNSAKYWLGSGDFDIVFAARESKTYSYPNVLKFPRVEE